MIEQDMENPAAVGAATGQEACQRLIGKPCIWGKALSTLKLEDSLSLKPGGWYRIDMRVTPIEITVHHPGYPEQVIIAHSPGHANRLRLELSDIGMAGLIEGGFTWPNP